MVDIPQNTNQQTKKYLKQTKQWIVFVYLFGEFQSSM